MTIDRHIADVRKTTFVLPAIGQNGGLRFLLSILPGVGLTFGIALVALMVQRLSGIAALSPLICLLYTSPSPRDS